MLPKISHPIYELALPSNGQKVKYRPFLVKEEKLLLMAKQGSDPREILTAVKQVINNCILQDNIDIDKLPSYDIDWFFIQLRSRSINNLIELKFRDMEDDQVRTFKVDLNDITIKQYPDHKNTIKVDDQITIQMRYPTPTTLDQLDITKSWQELSYETILLCIDKVFDGEEMIEMSECPREEAEEFLDSLTIDVKEQMQHFMQTIPHVYYQIKYTNSQDHERVIELSSLNDFFTWG